MFYITVKQSPIYKQMTLEELIFGTFPKTTLICPNDTNTKTYECVSISEHFSKNLDIVKLINVLTRFNNSAEELRGRDRKSLYTQFHIPKKTGGLRTINAPKPELMDKLRELKGIFENDFHALYHTSAFAYIKGRCTVDAVKKHQSNESKWFAKLDLHDFFGSTTLDFVMKMFGKIYPFSEVVKADVGKRELEKALELAFLDGGLPQGTPISPIITNIMMIPIDFKLFNKLRDYERQRFVYTRYADDFIISSKYDFNPHSIEKFVIDILKEFEAPFSINAAKTRYGSSAGRNWNLGVMLNKDNKITVGHKRKKQFQSMLYNYVTDRCNEKQWNLEDLQALQGLHSYYRMVEREAIDAIVAHIDNKMGVDVINMIKEDLK